MEFTTENILILLKSQHTFQFGVISLFPVISVFIYEILLPEYEALHTPFGTIWFAFKIVTVIVTISLKMGLKDFDTKTIFHVIILIMWVTSATFSMIILMPPLPIPWTITTFLHLFHTSPIAVATIVNLVVHLVLFFYTIRGTNQDQKLKISRMGAYYINNIPRLLSISHIMFPFVPFNIHFVTDNFLQYEHDLCRLIGFTAYFSLFITMLFWILIFVTICVTFWVSLKSIIC
ncbi:uncharacterized protein LOC129572501 [Sitodiplosis mosellana]|uniref:uncharacterized protein LOC129572501 n=1 Tax=Sitodiplosis mosellana TaxID=263140 RepID=UPI002444D916|nr:uncharacterized protein LOC129572501 [Sitodiplosis mosellana]